MSGYSKEQARNISTVYHGAGLFAPLLLFVLPTVAMSIHLVLPWVAILLVLWLPRDLTLSPDPDGSRLTVVYGLLPGAINLMAPLQATLLVDWTAPLWITAIIATILIVAIMIIDKCVSGIRTSITLVLLVSTLYGYAAVRELNVMLDHSSAVVYRSKVIDKRFSRTSQSIKIEPWGSLAAPVLARVDAQLWERTRKGDPICAEVHEGAFGLQWYFVSECPY